MDNLTAPLRSLLKADRAAAAVESLLMSCPELPDWAPPQKNCPKTPMSRPANDYYESWQGMSW